MVDETTAGIYVQLSRTLRIKRRPRPDLESTRPTKEDRKGRYYTDDPDTNPTLIELEIGDQADVASMLEIGAIRPYAPPAQKAGK